MKGHRLRVLDHGELLGWLRLHGSVLRATHEPLDNGESLDGETLAELQRELGASS